MADLVTLKWNEFNNNHVYELINQPKTVSFG